MTFASSCGDLLGFLPQAGQLLSVRFPPTNGMGTAATSGGGHVHFRQGVHMFGAGVGVGEHGNPVLVVPLHPHFGMKSCAVHAVDVREPVMHNPHRWFPSSVWVATT